MKRKILILATILQVLAVGFAACDKKETNAAPEKWVWSKDSLTITLDLYVADGKFYTTVAGKLPEDYGIQGILFRNDVWQPYKMVGDTMYTGGNEDFPPVNDWSGKWLVHQHTDKFFEIEYMGMLPAIPIIKGYIFTPRK